MVDQAKLHHNYVDEEGVAWKKVGCFSCQPNCNLYIGSKDGKIVEMAGDPKLGGTMCERNGVKGHRAIAMHEHPNRINHALKRVGEKGEGKWEEIPYDQAIEEIAEKLQALKDEYGPETLGFIEGTYRSDCFWARARFNAGFGGPSNLVDAGQVCGTWNTSQQMAWYGCGVISKPFPDPTTECQVIQGKRMQEQFSRDVFGDAWQQWGSTPDKKRSIVIDPVLTEEARYADVWLPLRAGTDAALLLGMVNIMISEKLYQTEFVKNWTTAPFLYNNETGKLLREMDVVEGGSDENYVVWDLSRNESIVWISDNVAYAGDIEGVDPALEGSYEVTLVDGTKIAAAPVLTKIAENAALYPVETVAAICGLSAKQIIDAVHIFAECSPAVNQLWGIGGGDQSGKNATNCEILKHWLRCLSGSLDAPGGQFIGGVGPHINGELIIRDSVLELNEMISDEMRDKLLGNEEYPLVSWKGYAEMDKWQRKRCGFPKQIAHHVLVNPTLAWDAIEYEDPYALTAMICWAGNPMAWCPDTTRVHSALKKLKLFVVVEYWMTPTAALADYVMPAADWMERPMASTTEDMFTLLTCGDRGVEPIGDRHDDYSFFRKLGLAMGQGKDIWPWDTYEEACESRVSHCGATYEDMCSAGEYADPPMFHKYLQTREDGRLQGWWTPSARAEIYSIIYENIGVSNFCEYHEPAESWYSTPEIAQEYPLILTTGGRSTLLFHSEGRVPGMDMREYTPWPFVLINPTTARRLNIREGQWTWIETPRGRIRMRARLTQEVDIYTVITQASWWYPEQPMEEPCLGGVWESSANVLTSSDKSQIDDRTGGWCFRGLLCKIYPCEEAPEWFLESDMKYGQ